MNAADPLGRLTRIGDEMTEVFRLHADHEAADKCIVFLDDGAQESGIVMQGYVDDYEGLIALLVHLRLIFNANGQDLELHPLVDDDET